MNEEILADIRNKLTVPKTALDKMANGEEVPKVFLAAAVKELDAAIDLLTCENNTK
jgi:hypothetical protein